MSVESGQRINHLDFGGNPLQDLDSGFMSPELDFI